MGVKMNELLGKVVNSIKFRIQFKYYIFKYYFIKDKFQNIKVLSIDETILKIIEDHVSVSRFGDGEFRWMCGENYSSFETYTEELEKRLKEVLNKDERNHIVCISPSLIGIEKNDVKRTKDYWRYILGKEGVRWIGLLNVDRT